MISLVPTSEPDTAAGSAAVSSLATSHSCCEPPTGPALTNATQLPSGLTFSERTPMVPAVTVPDSLIGVPPVTGVLHYSPTASVLRSVMKIARLTTPGAMANPLENALPPTAMTPETLTGEAA